VEPYLQAVALGVEEALSARLMLLAAVNGDFVTGEW
jgi:hypothetical protein